MKQVFSNSTQLSFSIGRPLPVLLEELQRTTRHPQLKKAAEQMLEALHTFAIANQTGLSKSQRANVAIQEILTK